MNFLDKGKKILWIAHRYELLEQAKDAFYTKVAFDDIFKSKTSFNYRIISGIHDKPVNIKATDDIIFASKDSLNSGFNYLYNNWLKGQEEVFLIVDEAHHATAKTYRKLINNVRDKVKTFRMVGLTATPFRTAQSEQGLLGKVFPDDIIYKIDLRTMIDRGILAQPKFESVETKFNMNSVLSDEEITNLKYFDIDKIGKYAAKTIAENDQRNKIIVNRYVENESKYKPAIVFALNQDNAIALNALFTQKGVKAEWILSSIRDIATGVTISKEMNKEKSDKFRKGEFDVLINVNIATEGADYPKVQSIFLARPTISSILMTQMVGRGLRGPEANGTKDAYIVSFIDDWQDRVSWVNPESVLIGEPIDPKDPETSKNIIRLISIKNLEDFAILTDKYLNRERYEQLQKLEFIERIPVGIYHFSILNSIKDNNEIVENEKNVEVLVYDNLMKSYQDFMSNLPNFFKINKLDNKDNLTEIELDQLCPKIEEEYFSNCPNCPGYLPQDIKDILQYYAQYEAIPQFIELKNREKFDLTKVADEIISKDLAESKKH